jgi:hypothetical protein
MANAHRNVQSPSPRFARLGPVGPGRHEAHFVPRGSTGTMVSLLALMGGGGVCPAGSPLMPMGRRRLRRTFRPGWGPQASVFRALSAERKMLLNRRRGTIPEHEASSGLPACHHSDRDESQVPSPPS